MGEGMGEEEGVAGCYCYSVLIISTCGHSCLWMWRLLLCVSTSYPERWTESGYVSCKWMTIIYFKCFYFNGPNPNYKIKITAKLHFFSILCFELLGLLGDLISCSYCSFPVIVWLILNKAVIVQTQCTLFIYGKKTHNHYFVIEGDIL